LGWAITGGVTKSLAVPIAEFENDDEDRPHVIAPLVALSSLDGAFVPSRVNPMDV
jgi:hypothetical protein